jgi:hypothetical protein
LALQDKNAQNIVAAIEPELAAAEWDRVDTSRQTISPPEITSGIAPGISTASLPKTLPLRSVIAA